MAFTLTHDRLEAAFHRARLHRRGDGAILFGIRGCTPSSAATATLEKSHSLSLTTIDYLHPRCTLGYWRPGTGFAVFPASTVPAQRYVRSALATRGEGTNQLCFGFHRGYRRGTHNSASRQWGHRALRMERAVPVLRTADDLDYDADDRLEYETAYDNIHCGWVAGSQTPGYSSAGCQVVVGTANPETGPWKAFVALVYGDGQQEFDYALFSAGEIQRVAQAADPAALPLALRYGSQGDEVLAVQNRLTALGYPTAGADGDFGWRTLLAVLRFQKHAMGVTVPDGIVGEQTSTALGLQQTSSVPALEDLAPLNGVEDEEAPAEAAVASAGPIFRWRTETSDNGRFTHHYGAADDAEVYVGYETTPKGPVFKGLVQSTKRLGPTGAQRYRPQDYEAWFGDWAHFVVPTATAESDLWFERINTYDRAAFTFGFMQAAAHYPDANFILLFKDMLARPEAATYFPDLFLKPSPKGPRLFRKGIAGDEDLEVAEPRGGGSDEPNLKKFMSYLNPSLTAVEESERTVAARLMHWTRTFPECRRLQVKAAIRALQERMGHVRQALRGRPVDQCLIAADVRYQGRAGPVAISNALASAHPYHALLQLGREQHSARIDKVDEAVRQLMEDSRIAALRFDPTSATLFRSVS